jgi:hypothetical protein
MSGYLTPRAKREGNNDPGHDSRPVNTTQRDKPNAEERVPWQYLGSKNPDPFRHSKEN